MDAEFETRVDQVAQQMRQLHQVTPLDPDRVHVWLEGAYVYRILVTGVGHAHAYRLSMQLTEPVAVELVQQRLRSSLLIHTSTSI